VSILVTGGNGRLGRAVLAQLGTEGLSGVRRSGIPGSVQIDSEGRIDTAMLAGVTAIINCAGRVTGTTAEIDAANIAYPLALARAARDAGVPRFVQVSSFSVYGRVEHIDAVTPLMPDGDYGRSKVAAEQGLAALATPAFTTVALRLPFMFSVCEPALMGRLVPLVRRMHVLPVRSGAVARRSMITYAGAAQALLVAARMPVNGASTPAAADPRPLALDAIAQALRDRGHRVATLPLPGAAIAIAARLVPGVVDRLFRSSVLVDSANMMRDGTAYPVVDELAGYIARLDRGSAGQAGEN